MDIVHTQLKLFNTEHAWGRKVQIGKITFEAHVVVPNSAVLLLFHVLMHLQYPPKSC